MDWRHPSIVAMKGLPCTGKSFLARQIAFLHDRCSLISLDEILDSLVTTPPTHDGASSSSSPPFHQPDQERDQLNSMAFEILCQVVSTQLSLGVSVVIDSPLLSQTHLDRLVHLSSSLNATKFIIIECRVEVEYAWQMRFEKLAKSHRNKWYNPRSWDDMAELIRSYKAMSLDNDIHTVGASRLLVNVDHKPDVAHLVQAVQALVFCHGDHTIDFEKWKVTHMDRLHDHYDHDHRICRQKKSDFNLCPNGHTISTDINKEIRPADSEAPNCGVCEEPVTSSGASYRCLNCKMTLHDHCAELQAENRAVTPQKFHPFFEKSPPAYAFPENHTCAVCREAGKGFSEKCGSCIFESHLKCGLVPTILTHNGHPHKLHFWARPVNEEVHFGCLACGEDGTIVGYRCLECRVLCHVECALLPHPVLHDHGGYKHMLELRFSRDQVLEDYVCDLCLDVMSPEAWFYCCDACCQSYHLYCVFKDEGYIES